ncbi:trehalase-like isoform X1 [Mytilus californianus]|uniref:trehalase-like isoform X1 n=2 Tax=Mytilus californianus TaxID=6549 RepID=UPI002246447A|nr:trehalase-like isoform X1 [Mytilus californianus]
MLIILLCFGYTFSQELAACDSQIYCDGPLLHAVQMAKIFPDGKTFVDMSMKESPDVIISAFNNLTNQSTTTLKNFVSMYFTGPGEELETWAPTDYVKLPRFLNDIKDPQLKDFGWDLCRIWKDLGRKVKDDVKINPDRYSMIYLPKPFIVPGGRFRETFYWDSYWVIKGLLVCEMNTTVKGMMENFIHYVKTFGFIPNGGRTYFTRRSQPPFFIPMMYEYYKSTDDLEFIRNNFHILEAEYEFWMKNRTISVEKDRKMHILNQYQSDVIKPRPESYFEDVKTAEQRNIADRPKLYSNLVSACESGWDFSSRWFSREKGENLTMNTIATMDIIPVDLNSILCLNERILMTFAGIIGDSTKEQYYHQKLTQRKEAIEAVLYNKDAGIWQDFSLHTNKSREFFFMSNIFPVYMECTDLTNEKKEKILQHLQTNKITEYFSKGGVPTSLDDTGQQWDFPNGWSPLQQIMIWSLESIPQTKHLARSLASSWLDSNFLGWQRTRGMFEKYNVLEPGTRGGGGEYDIQEGFGWTNGVALEILKKYGDVITTPDSNPQSTCINGCAISESNLLIVLLAYIVYSNYKPS